MVDISKNPGFILRKIIKEMVQIKGSNDFITQIDRVIDADGEFRELVYNSTVNYLLKRMIINSTYIYKKFNTSDYPANYYQQEIRKYVRDKLSEYKTRQQQIGELLITIVQTRREIQDAKKKLVLNEAKASKLKCYICGKILTYDKPANPKDQPEEIKNSYAEVEHLWPHSLGGTNELYNLAASCAECNRYKREYIDSSDFHYEKMILSHLTLHDESGEFKSDFKGAMRIASLLHNDCRCNHCNKPAAQQGTMYFRRREPSENWHFLNIETYCHEHNS